MKSSGTDLSEGFQPTDPESVPIIVENPLEDVPESFFAISQRYLLISFIPLYTDSRGTLWLDAGWHHDLVRHLEYILDLTLLAPRQALTNQTQNVIELSQAHASRMRLIDLPSQASAAIAIVNLPKTFIVMWREVRRAQIVHSGVIGWPIPLGWIANPIALALRRKLLLVVESAPWRIVTLGRNGLKGRIREWFSENLACFFMRRADLAVVTQPEYLNTLRRDPIRGASIVNPASWIEERDIVSSARLAARSAVKRTSDPRKLRFIFAGRIEPEKGIHVLLDALRQLEREAVDVVVDIIGTGSLRLLCQAAEGEFRHVRLSVLNPVPYGPEFFDLLGAYHCVLVPSLSDEQPRILFDAFSQAVPVLAADTDGIRPHVADGRTGWLFARGSASELARSIVRLRSTTGAFEVCGAHARTEACRMTHSAMHRRRSRAIDRYLCR